MGIGSHVHPTHPPECRELTAKTLQGFLAAVGPGRRGIFSCVRIRTTALFWLQVPTSSRGRVLVLSGWDCDSRLGCSSAANSRSPGRDIGVVGEGNIGALPRLTR